MDWSAEPGLPAGIGAPSYLDLTGGREADGSDRNVKMEHKKSIITLPAVKNKKSPEYGEKKRTFAFVCFFKQMIEQHRIHTRLWLFTPVTYDH